MKCITTVSYSVLVTGKPSPWFNPAAGIRQEDPPSPYSFIFCMEVLSDDLLQLQEQHACIGIKVSHAASPINHILFADDAVFFTTVHQQQCQSLSCCLHEFCQASAELINMNKSFMLLSPNAQDYNRTMIHSISSM